MQTAPDNAAEPPQTIVRLGPPDRRLFRPAPAATEISL